MASTQTQWYDRKEVSAGTSWTFTFMSLMVKFLPRPLLVAISAIICFFFFLGAKPVRKNSMAYLNRVAKVTGRKKPTLFDSYKHVLSFVLQMLEKQLSWMGRLKVSDLENNAEREEFLKYITSGHGAILLSSHVGNLDMFRSLGEIDGKAKIKDLRICPIVDIENSSRYNDLLRKLNPKLMDNIINASDIGIDSAIMLKDKIDKGYLIVIAGDRTAAKNRERTVRAKFLGDWAEFPEGTFILASVLGAPIYFGAGIRCKNFSLNTKYEFNIRKASTQFVGSRKERMQKIQPLMEEFIAFVEECCKAHPYQWYNFFDFWEEKEQKS
jgi:predicted LPLAT superfamily acyltransferase